MTNSIENLYEEYKKSTGVCTDTRKIGKGNIFFALKGDNFDANEFALQALEDGARLAVIDNPDFAVEGKTWLVDDVLITLQELARHHRRNLKVPIIGLTGSNGKTTTKELIGTVLQKKYNTFATQGNLNNHIGVPLSILSIDDSVEIAVIEMGANHVGEIAFLCGISMPTHGFITNIGKAHIGEFGGFDNIIRGKSELYHYLIKTGGKIFVNTRQEILHNMAKRMQEPLFYPEKGSFCASELVETSPYIVYKSESGALVNTQITGKYNFDNIATALCVGKFFGVPEQEANEAVAGYLPANNRSQVLTKTHCTIILDAYNANPSSMEAAIVNLMEMRGEKKAVILGDMMELGEDTEKEHRNLGYLLNNSSIDDVFLCGKHTAYTAEECSRAEHFVTRDELIERIKNWQPEGHVILIKGSRSMALEKVVDFLE